MDPSEFFTKSDVDKWRTFQEVVGENYELCMYVAKLEGLLGEILLNQFVVNSPDFREQMRLTVATSEIMKRLRGEKKH